MMGRKIGSKNSKPYPIESHRSWKIYGDVDRSRLQYFKGMHNRFMAGKCKEIDWHRNREGYEAFCKEIGPIPSWLMKPSVGRKDHSKGYVAGNIQWEEYNFNSSKTAQNNYGKGKSNASHSY